MIALYSRFFYPDKDIGLMKGVHIPHDKCIIARKWKNGQRKGMCVCASMYGNFHSSNKSTHF